MKDRYGNSDNISIIKDMNIPKGVTVGTGNPTIKRIIQQPNKEAVNEIKKKKIPEPSSHTVQPSEESPLTSIEVDNEFNTKTNDKQKSLIDNIKLFFKKNIKPNKEKEKVKVSSSANGKYYIIFIRFILEIVGFGAAALSVRYTAIYLYDSLPIFWSWFLSSIMVIFSVMAFQIIIVFIIRKHRILSFLFSILWLIVTVFSMSSTVIGQYNANKERFFISSSIVADRKSTSDLYDLYEKDIIDLEINKSNRQKDLDRFNVLIKPYLDDPNKRLESRESQRDYSTYAQAISDAQRDIKLFITKIEEARNKQKELLTLEGDKNINKEEVPDFYDWVAYNVFSDGNPALIQFIISLFPAVFIDLIAPIGIAIGLFLERKEESI